MPTVKLVPSHYDRSSTTRVTVTDENNMYYDTSHTANYASIRGRNSTSNTYYAFINGFDFNVIPANAVVSAFTVKIRCYRNQYLSTGSSYRLRLASSASNSNVISGTTISTDIGTSAAVITIPTGNLTWAQLKNYGANFSIEIPLHASSSQYPYCYVYGAEIEVTYTLPTPYDITASTNSGTISPSGTTQVYAGDNYTLTIDVTNPTVTDNGVDVTSQLAQLTGGTKTAIPDDYSSTGFTVSNISNAYTDANSNTSATLNLAGRTTGNLYLDLESINLPSGATLVSVSCSATLQFSRNGSSSSVTASCQMYTGSTPKGTATTIVSSATDVAKTTFNLDVGTWTISELANARFYLTEYNGASSTQRIMYVYGVSFNVTYSISGVIYQYTITNVQANHTIIVTAGAVITPPVITVGTPNRTIISDETGYDQCVCTFKSDLALQQWEARATKAGVTPARGVGLLVESGGSLAANTNATVYVENEELTDGDGEYTITVYGQSVDGIWSA